MFQIVDQVQRIHGKVSTTKKLAKVCLLGRFIYPSPKERGDRLEQRGYPLALRQLEYGPRMQESLATIHTSSEQVSAPRGSMQLGTT